MSIEIDRSIFEIGQVSTIEMEWTLSRRMLCYLEIEKVNACYSNCRPLNHNLTTYLEDHVIVDGKI
jgi:hypothetical protein